EHENTVIYTRKTSGSTNRWEISRRTTRTDGSMGNIPAHCSGRGFDGKYPRETQTEGSVQDFPAGPGVGHGAAPTRSPRLGCSLRQAGEARPGSCREVKRRV